MANNFTNINEQLFNLLESLQVSVNKLAEQKQWPVGQRNNPRTEILRLSIDATASSGNNWISNTFNAAIYDIWYPVVIFTAGSQWSQAGCFVEIYTGDDWVPQRNLVLQSWYNYIDFDFANWQSAQTGFFAFTPSPAPASFALTSDTANFQLTGSDMLDGLCAKTRVRIIGTTGTSQIKEVVIFGKINA